MPTTLPPYTYGCKQLGTEPNLLGTARRLDAHRTTKSQAIEIRSEVGSQHIPTLQCPVPVYSSEAGCTTVCESALLSRSTLWLVFSSTQQDPSSSCGPPKICKSSVVTRAVLSNIRLVNLFFRILCCTCIFDLSFTKVLDNFAPRFAARLPQPPKHRPKPRVRTLLFSRPPRLAEDLLYLYPFTTQNYPPSLLCSVQTVGRQELPLAQEAPACSSPWPESNAITKMGTHQ